MNLVIIVPAGVVMVNRLRSSAGIDSTDNKEGHVIFIGFRAIDDVNCVLWFHSRMVDEIAQAAVILES